MIPKKPKLLDRVAVKGSSNVKSYAYDKRECLLQVEFHSGIIGDYLDVPSNIVDRFEAAESKGGFLSANIKPIYMWRAIQRLPPMPIDQELKVATPIYLAFLETRKLMRRTGGNLLYCLWVATGREPTKKKQNSRYAAALEVVGSCGWGKGLS